ncbi:hypothetical protein [Rhizobium sp.]|uniref:hypothetical protein n=1 Tax=Rhizobium sp. TaxID=391 RepID=UPI003F7E4321
MERFHDLKKSGKAPEVIDTYRSKNQKKSRPQYGRGVPGCSSPDWTSMARPAARKFVLKVTL